MACAGPSAAAQDKADDVRAGIRSTALTFGDRTKAYCSGFAAANVALLAVAGGAAACGPAYYAGGKNSRSRGRGWERRRSGLPGHLCLHGPGMPCMAACTLLHFKWEPLPRLRAPSSAHAQLTGPPALPALCPPGVAAAGAHLAWQIGSVDLDDSADCAAKFRSNAWYGALLFAGILADRLAPLLG